MFKTKVQTQLIETNEWEQSRHISTNFSQAFSFQNA